MLAEHHTVSEFRFPNAAGFQSQLVQDRTSEKPQVVTLDELSVPKKAKDYYAVAVKAMLTSDWDKSFIALNDAIHVYPRYASRLLKN